MLLSASIDKLHQKRWVQCGFWVLIISLFWSLDFHTQISHAYRIGMQPNLVHLAIQQITSALAVLLLVPATVWVSHRWPMAFHSLQSSVLSLIILLLGSLAFAFCHYLLIVVLRATTYPLFGLDYVFSQFWANLWFEYGKDIKIYAAMLAIIYAYRFWVKNTNNHPAVKKETLLVQTGRGECRVDLQDVQVVEAAKNYLSLYTADKEYLYRSTLTDFHRRFANYDFIQVHRSYLVKRKCIKESIKQEGGKLRLLMHNGQQVPVSRNLKKQVEAWGFCAD